MDIFFIFVIGACVGSFANVCIYRIPEGKSVVFPRSMCRCGAPIPLWLNVPILSWLMLRGRARCCGRRIGVRYPLVEALVAIVFTAIYLKFDTLPSVAIGCFFLTLMIVAAFIDVDRLEVYDAMSIGGMICAVALSPFFPEWFGAEEAMIAMANSLGGALLGSGLMFWVAIFGELACKREAVGGGDIKLLGTIGAFLGWKGAIFAIFGGCFIGTVILVPVLLASMAMKKKSLQCWKEIPFVPFLTAGSIAYIFFGQSMVRLLFSIS
jgi:leader peptidase (prepilin peptidase)/N-methyltransferase